MIRACRPLHLLALIASLGTASAWARQERAPAPGHWPQWRGPGRDNLSTESGLLKEWPEGGPKLLWKAEGLGEGVGCLSVAGGMVFLLGYREKNEFLTALDGDGKVVWSVPIGPDVKEMSMMRWLSQRTPTVDDDRVYAFTSRGMLLCLSSFNGKTLWERDYAAEFGGRSGPWGFCDFPLVEGELLLGTPGGPTASLVALNKRTGETVWKCAIPECARGTHSPTLVCELDGVRQGVTQLDCGAVGVDLKTGRRLWCAGVKGGTGNVHAAIPWKKDGLLTLNGWGLGCALLELRAGKEKIEVVEKYAQKIPLASWRSSELLVGDHLFTFDGGIVRIDVGTGQVVRKGSAGFSAATVTHADGLFYVRGTKGEARLVEAGPEKEDVRGTLTTPHGNESTWTFPVVAGGRLYLRDQGTLYGYDVRGPDYRERPSVWNLLARAAKEAPRGIEAPKARPGKEPDAIFVATPQDVVEKMIEIAGVTKDDVVYDLGSGDGRIVIAASKKHGCASVGVEIDPALVRESRSRVKEARLETLVSIQEKDLFTVDLSAATVVTLYLGAPNNAKLLPALRKLKPGSRIVSHAHLLGDAGPKPDQGINVTSQEDQTEHTIYLWTTPLKETPK
jgi:outer membrane protein assembly factor BamB